MAHGSASIDRFALPAPVPFVVRDTKTRSMSSQTVSAAVRNLILITAGQSNGANIAPSAYTPANPTKIDNMNIWDGAIYAASDPVLGCSWPNPFGVAYLGPGHPYLRLADTFITNNKFDRVILVPTCMGASSIEDWSSGVYMDFVPVAMRRLAANNIVSGTNVTFAAILNHGETDNVLNTSQADYTSRLNTVIANSRTAGFTGIWFINSQSYVSGVTDANITNAQAAVVNHGSNVWAGANADALTGANRAADNLHWSDAGSIALAAATYTAMGLAGAPF